MKIPTIPSLQEMLEAGFHFGHKKQFSDARGRDNFFEVREKVVVINLEKTQSLLQKALEFVAGEAAKGATFLFVGTKPQAREAVAEAAKKTNMPYITNRWLGGTLTNFETIKKNLKKLKAMEEELNKKDETLPKTKKELQELARTIERSKYNLEGIISLSSLPDVVVVVDPKREKAAVKEAFATGIPVVAVLDTDANPTNIEFPIPANEDSVRVDKIIFELLADAIALNHIAKKAPTPRQDVGGQESRPGSVGKESSLESKHDDQHRSN